MSARVLVVMLVAACGNVPAAPDAQTEFCLDGADNDGDGLADCADPDCDPAARCVPDSTTEPAGVIVAGSEQCPAGFTAGETVIHRGLVGGACSGCGCTLGPTTCTASVWIYKTDLAECDNDTNLSGGTHVTFDVTPTCSPMNLGDGQIYGARADIIPQTSCTPSGSATPGASTWAESVKFCKSSHVAAGCDAGATCVARAADPASQCALAESGTCSAAYTSSQSDWYTDYDDQRTCGTCSCSPVGDGCSDVLVQVGSDYSCINAWQVADGGKTCFPPFGDYSPPALLVGAPTDATACTTDAPATGPLTPTGQTMLCCTPN